MELLFITALQRALPEVYAKRRAGFAIVGTALAALRATQVLTQYYLDNLLLSGANLRPTSFFV